MANEILPVSSAALSSAASAGADSRTNVSSTDFMKILLAQMANPDLGSLFNSNSEDQTSSVFGGSANSLFGSNTSLLTQALSGQNTTAVSPFTTPQIELSIWSNLIGKTVDGVDPLTGENVSGVVKSVILESEAVLLDLGEQTIKPSSITKVS